MSVAMSHYLRSRAGLTTKIRAGFWCPSFRTGGSEIWTLSLIDSLNRNYIDLIGLGILHEDGNDQSMVDRSHLPVFYGASGLRFLASFCDVVVMWIIPHINEIVPPGDTKYVMVSHADGEWHWWADQQAQASPYIDRFVAVSESAKLSIPVSRRPLTTVIPNYVDISRLVINSNSRDHMRELWEVGDRKVLLTVARLQEEKNPLLLFEATKYLPDNYYAILAGDGPMADQARSFVSRSGGRCSWIGNRSDVGRVLSGADFYVSGSTTEGFGLSIAEAMYVGLPVVAPAGVGLLNGAPLGVAITYDDVTPIGLANTILTNSSDEVLAAVAQRGREFVLSFCDRTEFGRRWTEFLIRTASQLKYIG